MSPIRTSCEHDGRRAFPIVDYNTILKKSVSFKNLTQAAEPLKKMRCWNQLYAAAGDPVLIHCGDGSVAGKSEVVS